MLLSMMLRLLPLTSPHAHIGATVEAAEGAVEAVQVPDPDTPAVGLAPCTHREGGQGARGGAPGGGGSSWGSSWDSSGSSSGDSSSGGARAGGLLLTHRRTLSRTDWESLGSPRSLRCLRRSLKCWWRLAADLKLAQSLIHAWLE